MNSIRTSGPSSGWGLGRWSVYPTYCVVHIALAVLTGWQRDMDWLRRPFSELVVMKPTAAVGFLFSSLSFLCFRSGGLSVSGRRCISGFSASARNLGMKERALMVGNSEAEVGMTVYVKIPMEPTTKPI